MLQKHPDVAVICKELQHLQRYRAWYLKSRIMISNRILHAVAGTIGYHSGMEPGERQKLFSEATNMIKEIRKKEAETEVDFMVRSAYISIDAFEDQKMLFETSMVDLAKQLPITQWIKHPDQKGFSWVMLAVLIGETGDLFNYSSPAKVWRRMGCAPFEKDGVMLMGSTWTYKKDRPKLSDEEWVEFGYSRRRRSIAYIISENLMKAQGTEEKGNRGIYRKRYDVKKAEYASLHAKEIEADEKKHWKERKWTNQRLHRHGLLLMSKLLMKNLWLEWWGRDNTVEVYHGKTWHKKKHSRRLRD